MNTHQTQTDYLKWLKAHHYGRRCSGLIHLESLWGSLVNQLASVKNAEKHTCFLFFITPLSNCLSAVQSPCQPNLLCAALKIWPRPSILLPVCKASSQNTESMPFESAPVCLESAFVHAACQISYDYYLLVFVAEGVGCC